MSKFSHTRSIFGATTTATPTTTGSAGDFVIGSCREMVEFDDFDICYEFKITTVDALTIVGFDIETSTLTTQIGTPTIEGGNGEDFEGIAFPDIDGVGVVAWELIEAQDSFVDVSSVEANIPPNFPNGRMESDGQILSNIYPEPFQIIGKPTMTFIFNAAGQVLKGTIFAKSN